MFKWIDRFIYPLYVYIVQVNYHYPNGDSVTMLHTVHRKESTAQKAAIKLREQFQSEPGLKNPLQLLGCKVSIDIAEKELKP